MKVCVCVVWDGGSVSVLVTVVCICVHVRFWFVRVRAYMHVCRVRGDEAVCAVVRVRVCVVLFLVRGSHEREWKFVYRCVSIFARVCVNGYVFQHV